MTVRFIVTNLCEIASAIQQEDFVIDRDQFGGYDLVLNRDETITLVQNAWIDVFVRKLGYLWHSITNYFRSFWSNHSVSIEKPIDPDLDKKICQIFTEIEMLASLPPFRIGDIEGKYLSRWSENYAILSQMKDSHLERLGRYIVAPENRSFSKSFIREWTYDLQAKTIQLKTCIDLETISANLPQPRPAQLHLDVESPTEERLFLGKMPPPITDHNELNYAERLKKCGITDVIVLLPKDEIKKYRGKNLLDFYRDHHIECHHFPIPDYGIPARIETLLRYLKNIEDALKYTSKNFYVHCAAGKGRTGLFTACLKIYLNPAKSSEEIIKQVRKENPGAIEAPEQEDYVKRFYQYIHEREDSEILPSFLFCEEGCQ